MKNKNHWYDGWFYDAIIAPNQDKLFAQIRDLIKPQSSIIDVGCGTGRLEFFLSDNCRSLLGIDLSKRNIDKANMTLLNKPDSKISFRHSDVRTILNAENHFDFAIMTYVIHEVNEDERIDLLKDISLVADKIIIGDYSVPRPQGPDGFLSGTIEFIAGREHYRNYKSYVANGGLNYLAEKAGLKITDEILNFQSINRIVVLEK
jgi:SAM-dependent methyltransferase